MKIQFLKNAKDTKNTLVAFASKDKSYTLCADIDALDASMGGFLRYATERAKNFDAKCGECLTLALPEQASADYLILVGLGNKDECDSSKDLTLSGGKLYTALKTIKQTDITILCDHPALKARAQDAGALLVKGLRLASYHYDAYLEDKAIKKHFAPKTITVVSDNHSAQESTHKMVDAVSEGVYTARDLLNDPPNDLYPESYAEKVKKMLKPLGVKIEILDEKKMLKLGMGAIMAVGQGSERQPRMVLMHWNGTKAKNSKPLALVGKGVTFDTGGISIKPAGGMDEMKMDMGGSATVVGAMHALALSKAPVNVIGAIGLAENMPSHNAYRPGDIVTSMAGKTIEILNTDAEGRLVLADTMTYVQREYKPKAMIDLATLTGAIMVALGHEYAGAFVNDEALWSQLEQASKDTGEKMWRMPLDKSYREEMHSTIATLRNLSNVGRYGGACSAAGFLEQFVEDDLPWAHLDIAGVAWAKSKSATVPKGGVGWGVQMLYKMIMDHYG